MASLLQPTATGGVAIEANLESVVPMIAVDGTAFADALATALVEVGVPTPQFDLTAAIPGSEAALPPSLVAPVVEMPEIPVFSRATVSFTTAESGNPAPLDVMNLAVVEIVSASPEAPAPAVPSSTPIPTQAAAPPPPPVAAPPDPLVIADPGKAKTPTQDLQTTQAQEAAEIRPNVDPQTLDPEPNKESDQVSNNQIRMAAATTGMLNAHGLPMLAQGAPVVTVEIAEAVAPVASPAPNRVPKISLTNGGEAKLATASPIQESEAPTFDTELNLKSLPVDPKVPIVSVQVAPATSIAPVLSTNNRLDIEIPEATLDPIEAPSEIEAGDAAIELSDEALAPQTGGGQAETSDSDANPAQGSQIVDVSESHEVSAGKSDTDRIGFREALRSADPIAQRQLQANERFQVVRQVADQLEIMAATRPREAVVVHLQPQDLGSVTLTIKQMGSMLEANISATEERVRTALDQGRPELIAQLNQRGVGIQTLTVGKTESSNTESFGQPQQDRAQQSSPQNQNPSRQQYASQAQSYSASNAEPAARRATTTTSGGVDLWI